MAGGGQVEEAALPIHRRILADIREKILSGAWPPGHRVPFEHELVAAYGCSRMTVNKALSELAKAGLIERRRRSGSFVRRPRSQAAVLEIHDIRTEVEALGLPYGYRLLAREVRRSTPADRARLGVNAAVQVVALSCLHLAGARPFCLEERLISLAAVPDALKEPFDRTAPGPWLIGHVPWSSAEHRIRATGADRAVSAALDLRAGAPCLVVERRTWSAERPVTQAVFTYPGDGHVLVARFQPEG